VAIHGAILAVAGVLALRTFTHDPNAAAEREAEADVWSGTADKVEQVRFEHKLGTIVLEPRNDKEGRYFVGTVVKDKAADDAQKKQNQPPDQQASVPPTPPADAAGKTTAQFIAVKDAEDLLQSVAPLKALRVLGKVDDAKKADFGFNTEEGRLHVTIGGKEHSLVFGGATPGGSDYYAKDPQSGEAYVVAGSILRDLTSADTRLLERNLHQWPDTEAKKAKITIGNATRDLVRNDQQKEFWSRADKPAEKDETASNWMTKIDRLRVTRYEGEKPSAPVSPTDVVCRVDYFDDRRPLGYIEIVRRPGEGDRHEYIARTEHIRWYATVLRSSAEQIDQDAKSIAGP
jgi:hypothetical protein